ncbi:TPA: hypothetical protein QIF36_002355 [Enterobacter kobei]|nr:hypothetical protein [Enterobacter kobei]
MKTNPILVEVTLNVLNKEIATFKAGDIVSGVIHITNDGTATIIFDGGYLFGEFHCSACAIKNLNSLIVNYVTAKRNCGLEYSEYKRLHQQ